MIKNYKRGYIAPANLFILLAVSRVIVCLTYVQSVSMGKMDTDILISIAAGFFVTVFLSIPIILCINKGKNPLKCKPIAYVYGAYYILLAGVIITRFSYFITSRLNQNAINAFFIIIIVMATAYAAYLGIESISRFATIASIIVALGILMIIFFNFSEFRFENLFPIVENSPKDIFLNSLLISSNTAEVVVLMNISQKVNGKCTKPFIWAMAISYLLVFAVLLTTIAVMGKYVSLQSFPVYSLSQLARVGEYKRFDTVYSAIWITAILIYCASQCFYVGSKENEKVHFLSVFISGIAVSAIAIFAISDYISKWLNSSKIFFIVIYVIFSTIVPLVYLMFKKNNRGEELLEKF